jgi:hypothetical protein
VTEREGESAFLRLLVHLIQYLCGVRYALIRCLNGINRTPTHVQTLLRLTEYRGGVCAQIMCSVRDMVGAEKPAAPLDKKGEEKEQRALEKPEKHQKPSEKTEKAQKPAEKQEKQLSPPMKLLTAFMDLFEPARGAPERDQMPRYQDCRDGDSSDQRGTEQDASEQLPCDPGQCDQHPCDRQDPAEKACSAQVPSDEDPTNQDSSDQDPCDKDWADPVCMVKDPSDVDWPDQDPPEQAGREQDSSDQLGSDGSHGSLQDPCDEEWSDPDCLIQDPCDVDWPDQDAPEQPLHGENNAQVDQENLLKSWSVGSWSDDDESWSVGSWTLADQEAPLFGPGQL